MTAYLHRERRAWRHQLRRLVWRFNLALSVLVLLLVLLPSVANAAPRCPGGGTATPRGCAYAVRGRPSIWPVRIGVERYAVAIDPEVQP